MGLLYSIIMSEDERDRFIGQVVDTLGSFLEAEGAPILQRRKRDRYHQHVRLAAERTSASACRRITTL